MIEPLAAELSTFLAVGRHRSFRGAAARLRLSPAAVSQRIRTLEAQLGCRLLERTTRQVALSEPGQQLYERLTPLAGELHRALEDLATADRSPRGHLRITVPRVAAYTFILPAIREFREKAPRVSIEVSASDALIDLVREGFDAGIRFEKALARDHVAVRVGPDERLIMVGSPEYFVEHPAPRTLEDLKHHDLIGLRFPGGALYQWELQEEGRPVRVTPNGRFVADDLRVIADAARAGLGLAFVFERQVVEDLAAGRLVQVMERFCPSFPGVYIYYPETRLMRPALRAFVDHLRGAC